jgi:diguanylate cyclase (GGDEF)-like protein
VSGTDAVATQLRRLSAAALRATSVEDVVDAFLAAARVLIGVDQTHLIEVSQDAAVGHARVVAYEAGGRREDAYVMVLDERPSGVTTVVRTGEPLVVPEARGSEYLRADYVERFGVRSLVFAPIAWDGAVRWTAILARTRPEPFGPDHVELCMLLADLAASGLALLEGREAREAREGKDAALHRAAAALNASLDLDTVLRTLTREASSALGGDMGGVYLGDGTRGGVATAGHNTPPDWEGYVMRPGEGVGGQVLKTGRPAITNAYQEDVRLPATSIAELMQTAIAVPMSWDGHLRGALSIGFSRMRRVSPSDMRLLEAFADLASVACRNAEAFRSAAQLDALTGVLEHGALEAALAQVLADGGEVGCLLVDLDAFHAVNAREGHRRGDDVLRRVAALLRRECGEDAPVGRFGGDQFAAVVGSDAAALAERVLAELASDLHLAASIGVAVGDEAAGAAALLDRALSAARAAKEAGGGQVISAA